MIKGATQAWKKKKDKPPDEFVGRGHSFLIANVHSDLLTVQYYVGFGPGVSSELLRREHLSFCLVYTVTRSHTIPACLSFLILVPGTSQTRHLVQIHVCLNDDILACR